MSGLSSLLPLITAVQLRGAQGGAGARHAAPVGLQPGKEGVLGEIWAGRSQGSANLSFNSLLIHCAGPAMFPGDHAAAGYVSNSSCEERHGNPGEERVLHSAGRE